MSTAGESGTRPAHWPKEVEELTIAGTGKLGVHKRTGELYWDGEPLQTRSRLHTPERVIAIIATAATVSMAIADLIRLYHGN